MKRTLAAALLLSLISIPGRAEDAPSPSPAKEHWSKTYVGTGGTLVAGGALLAAYGFMGEKHYACPSGGGGDCSANQDRKAARIAGVALAAAGAGILLIGHGEAKRRSPSVGFIPGLRSGMVWVSF